MQRKGSIKKGRKPSEATVLSSWPLDTYKRRLGEQIDTGWLAAFGSRPLIGRLANDRLRASRRNKYRNSFQTCVKAELRKHPGGTQIQCRFGVHPFAIAFLAIWLLLVAGFLVAALVQLRETGITRDQIPFLVVPLFMLVVGAVMYPLGRHLARNEQDEILQILQDI